MNDKNKKLNCFSEWSKSQEALKEAEVLLTQNFFGGCLSRSYYAAFHAAKALLMTEGLEAKTHQGVGRLFSLHFIKSKKFDSKLSRIFSHAQKDREEADYCSEYVFTQEDARERLTEVKQFISEVESYLKSNNFL